MNLNVDLNFNSRRNVSIQLPAVHVPHRIAFIKASPSSDDVEAGIPLTDAAGQIFDSCISKAGILRSGSLVATLSPYVTTRLNMSEPDVYEHCQTLRDAITEFDPHLVVLLGQEAFTFGAGEEPWKKVDEFRGTLFRCRSFDSPFYGRKCLVTHDPSRIISYYDSLPLFLNDIFRAKDEMRTSELNLPSRTFDLNLSSAQIVSRLNDLHARRKPIALDIEGYIHNISCVSIAASPTECFIVPLTNWPIHEMREILRALSRLLTDPAVPKILQNSLYDNLALSMTYNMPIRGVIHDTMLAGWEMFPELPKGLGTLTSIYTKEPAYKFLNKTDDQQTFYRYCCTDSAVTYEISNVIDGQFNETQRSHYNFNVSLLPAFLYMELRGIRYDTETADQLLRETNIKMSELTTRMSAQIGSTFNPNSPKQVADALYRKLYLPVQHPKKKVGYGYDRTKETTDVNALLKLCGEYRDPFLTDLLNFRKLEKHRQALEMRIDTDGRVRCSYNAIGTETGRVSCSTQSRVTKDNKFGANLQTITKPLRKLFRADDGFEFFQADLAGADGWTVAAHCCACGDTTMFDDYLFGLKPAKIIVLMQRYGTVVNTWSREQIKEESRSVSEEGPEGANYFAAKVIQHGTSYKMGASTMSQNITLQAYKKRGNPIYVSRQQCAAIQALFFARYPGIERWHSKIAFSLRNARGFPTLPSASGHLRTFFGRPNTDDTLRSALSHEPQANTTYATNLAMFRLWHDPENRLPSGGFRIEPLHQVHDALCGQWRIEEREWAIKKVLSYFSNPITVAGLTFTIPFDGQYGPSWGELKHAFSE